MVKIAVSVEIKGRYLRIRGKKRSVLVKEHTVRTVLDVGRDGKAKIVLYAQIQTVRERFYADGVRGQGQGPDRISKLVRHGDRAGEIRRIFPEDIGPRLRILFNFNPPRFRLNPGNIAENGGFRVHPVRQVKNNVRISRINHTVYDQIRVKSNRAGQDGASRKHNSLNIVLEYAVGQYGAASDGQTINRSRRRDGNRSAAGHGRAYDCRAILDKQPTSAHSHVFQRHAGRQIDRIIRGNEHAPDRAGAQVVIYGALREIKSVHISSGFNMNRRKRRIVVCVKASAV